MPPFLYFLLISGNTLTKRKREGDQMGKSEKKYKPVDLTKLEPEDKLKYEIAAELGLLDRVVEDGWRSLSSKETGRIGGLMAKRKRAGQ